MGCQDRRFDGLTVTHMTLKVVPTIFLPALLVWLVSGCGGVPADSLPTASVIATYALSQEQTSQVTPVPIQIGVALAKPAPLISPAPAAVLPVTKDQIAGGSTPTSTTGATAAPSPAATDTFVPPSVATSTPITCVYEWFFANPPGVCAEADALVSYAAAQPFAQGQMIWIETMDVFFLLFNAGTYPSDSRQVYRTVGPLVLKPGASPDNRVGETPPPGQYEPVSGFGLIWRNEVDGLDTDMRTAFGWALAPEFGFNTSFQCEQQQTYSAHTCYMRAPNGRVIVLGWSAYAGSVWALWT